MFMQNIFRLLPLLLVVPLISCGGGDVEMSYDGPTINVPDFSPASRTPTAVVSIGPITSLSGITVNSVEYDTSSASVTINGEPAVADQLRPGYVVAVYGTLDAGWKSGTAERISYNANAIGPVEGVDPVGQRLTIMGQSVRIGAETRFTPPLDFDSVFDLPDGTRVQVSGLPNADGEITATHVQVETDSGNAQAVGEISAIDHGSMRFRINELTVDYSRTLIMDLPNGAPNLGMTVIARGSPGKDGELQAFELKDAVDRSNIATDTLVQLTGFVSRYIRNNALFVNGFKVEIEFHTLFHNGMFANLSHGIRVEIDGRWGIGNSMTASEIWFAN
jgi:hypothetical protein